MTADWAPIVSSHFPMSDRQFQSFLNGEDCEELFDEYPFYPLNSPGIPLPGADFIEEAQRLGDSSPTTEGKGSAARLVSSGKYLDYLYLRALYDSNFSMAINVKGVPRTAVFVPGHLWGATVGEEGPRAASVMIIGRISPSNFGNPHGQNSRFLSNSAAALLSERLVHAGVLEEEFINWYVTSLVKHQNLNTSGNAIPQAWIKNCAPILAQELRLVRPDYILCLGSEASKYLLGAKGGVPRRYHCQDAVGES